MKFQYSIFALLVCTFAAACLLRLGMWSYDAVIVPNRPIAWQQYSADAVAKARMSGRLVVVHFTGDSSAADAVPLNAAMETPQVRRKLCHHGAVAFLAHAGQIEGNELAVAQAHRVNRLPLTMVYSPGDEGQPVMLTHMPTADDVELAMQVAVHRQRLRG